jgi:hypothetical protein
MNWEDEWFYVSAFAKVAFGVNDELMRINGSTTLVDPTMGNVTTPGGILALPSNIGDRQKSVLSIIPEVGVNLGVEPIKHLRLLAGYNALFWSQVVRPGTMIDRGVNPFNVPSDPAFGTASGPARPSFQFHQEAFWMQAVTVGLQLYY